SVTAPVRRSAEAGRDAAWTATGGSPTSSRQEAAVNTPADAAPAWAKRLRSEQTARAHRHTAMQAVREGDRPGVGANPSLNDKDD
ncbi:MAG: P-type conjugative transfer protein TrbL, partial [Mesorhizobium sp.]